MHKPGERKSKRELTPEQELESISKRLRPEENEEESIRPEENEEC